MSKIVITPTNTDIYNWGIENGYSHNQSTIMASRINDINVVKKTIEPFTSTLPPLELLEGISKAADMINIAVSNKERIAIVTDYDSDGVNSAVVSYLFLKHVFNASDNLVAIINKRLNGNGITEHLLSSILYEHSKDPISLVITADHGSANGKAIEVLKSKNIKVCVTDHHKVPEEGNAFNSDVFINPQKDASNLFDYISGCATIYFVFVYAKMKYNYRDEYDIENTALSMVAIATIGDSMRMDDPVNRYIVKAGIREMNTLKNIHWRVTRSMLKIPWVFNEEIIGFSIVPMINATSRISDPMEAFEFYLSEKPEDIEHGFLALDKVNKQRRKKQNELMTSAMIQGIMQSKNDALVLVVKNSFGINGILSSMIGEKFYKPIVTFVDNEGKYQGSARSINDEFDMLGAFKAIDNKDGSIIIKYGGHKKAAGVTIKMDKIDDFKRMLNDEAAIQLSGKDATKHYDVVSYLNHDDIHMGLILDINTLRPYGIGFKKPFYTSDFVINKVNCFGKDALHAKLNLNMDNGKTINAMMFNASEGNFDVLFEDNIGKKLHFVFEVIINTFKGNSNLELRIIYAE